MKLYEEELRFSKNKSELNNFNSLMDYLRSFYQTELEQLEESKKGHTLAAQDKKK